MNTFKRFCLIKKKETFFKKRWFKKESKYFNFLRGNLEKYGCIPVYKFNIGGFVLWLITNFKIEKKKNLLSVFLSSSFRVILDNVPCRMLWQFVFLEILALENGSEDETETLSFIVFVFIFTPSLNLWTKHTLDNNVCYV